MEVFWQWWLIMRTVGGSFTSFPQMCSNEHISKEQSAYSRTEHKCAKVGGDRHDGYTVVDDGSLKITQMYLLTMCLNMHRYESTSTGVRESCQGGCTLMCSNVLVSKQKSKRGLSGRVHSGWWWIPPPLSLSTVVPAGREWKPPCVLHNANTNTHTGKYRFRKVQKVIQMYTFYLFLGWLYILYRECQTVRLSSILQTQQQHGKKSF